MYKISFEYIIIYLETFNKYKLKRCHYLDFIKLFKNLFKT